MHFFIYDVLHGIYKLRIHNTIHVDNRIQTHFKITLWLKTEGLEYC